MTLTPRDWDHFADTPELAVRNAAQTYVPEKALKDLERQWKRTPPRDRKRGNECWHGVRGGERIELDGLTIGFHRIGTERFDVGMVLDALDKMRRHGSLQSLRSALGFLHMHVLGECFAISLRLAAAKKTVVFFGNLAIDTGDLQNTYPDIDLAVLPYCPANGDWLDESIAVANRIKPTNVMVHHFDQFFPPITVGLDMPGYIDALKTNTGVETVLPAKFFAESTLLSLLPKARQSRKPRAAKKTPKPRGARAAN